MILAPRSHSPDWDIELTDSSNTMSSIFSSGSDGGEAVQIDPQPSASSFILATYERILQNEDVRTEDVIIRYYSDIFIIDIDPFGCYPSSN
jgi:hypothetical protein